MTEILRIHDDPERLEAWIRRVRQTARRVPPSRPVLAPRPRPRPVVPPLYKNALVADFGPQDVAGGKVIEVTPPRDVLVVGLNGRGKTHLASALLLEWGGLFVRAADLGVEVRDARRSLERTEAGALRRYARAPVLALDDLTAGQDADRPVLLQLLEERISNRRPTILTCCQSREQVECWEPSIASRLKSFDLIHLVGADRRNKAHD